MSKTESTESPLEAATRAVDRQATEAFALLADETRLAIMLALWEEYDPHADGHAVQFSRIAERIDYDDPGNLRYHLEQLRGHFITQQGPGDGYELRVPGLQLVRTIIAGAGVEDTSLEPTVIDQACLLCGAQTAIEYRDGCLLWSCTECAGPTPAATDTDGFLSATPFAPAGLADRSAEEIRLASLAMAARKTRLMFDGFCPDCSGSVDGWVECCPEHESGGVCGECGNRFAAWARFECRVCKRHGIASPKTLALFHPAVVSFYDDHGVTIRVQAEEFETGRRVFEHMHDHGLDVVSTDPPEVAVTASMNGEAIRLTFDETASVVDIHRDPGGTA